MKLPTAQVGQQLQCGASANEKGEYVGLVGFGRGEKLIRGSCYIAGPLMIGNPSSWIAEENFNEANVMIARCGNTEADPESIPSIFKITNKDSGFETRVNDIELGDTGGGEVGIQINSSTFNQVNLETYTITTPNLELTGDLTHVGDTNQTGNITASDTITATDFVGNVSPCSGRSSGAKPFDMPHPSKDGYRLRYVCVEGPENGVYFRGKLDGTNTIEIPEYWKELVNHDTITVQLTPYGSPNVGLYVSEIAEDKITVATDDLLSLVKSEIKCFYHVYGERKDIERLIVEYEGTSPADYPGDNSAYQIAGYNYDITS